MSIKINTTKSKMQNEFPLLQISPPNAYFNICSYNLNVDIHMCINN